MIPGGPPKPKPKPKKRKPKPRYTPPPSRSDAAQGTGAKPVKPRTSPNTKYKYTPKSAVGDTSRPSDPVRVPRKRNDKLVRDSSGHVSVRTFRNTDDYKAYQRRLHVKAVIRRAEHQRIVNNAKADLAELTPRGEKLAEAIARGHRRDIRGKADALKSKYVKGGERPADYDERTQHELDRVAKRAKREAVRAGRDPGNKYEGKTVAKAATRRQVKRRVRKRMRAQEPLIDAIGTEMQKRHDRQIRRGKAPEGTSAARGIQVAARQRSQAAKAKALQEKHLARRKGGIGQWLTNAKDELVDTASSAPAAAVAGGKIALDTAQGIGENLTRAASITSGGGHPVVRRKEHGKELGKAARASIKGYVDTGVLPALASGHLSEALGRLKERPLAGVSEILPVAGLAAKGVRGASVAGRVAKAKPKGVKAARAKVREEGAKQRVRLHARPDLKIGANAAKSRTYSHVTGVRVVQKAKDKAVAKAGRDPHTKRPGHRVGPIKTGQKRALAKDFDVNARNVQHGGQSREERDAYKPIIEAHKRIGIKPTGKRHRRQRALLELMVRNSELRTGQLTQVKRVLHEIRDNLAKPENRREHTDDSLDILDRAIADINDKRHSAFILRTDVRGAANDLARVSHESDARQAIRGYAEGGRLDYVARLQGMIERGLVGPEPPRANPSARVTKEGGGSSVTPSPRPASAPESVPKPESIPVTPKDRLTEPELEPKPEPKPSHTEGRGRTQVTVKRGEPAPKVRSELEDATRHRQLVEQTAGAQAFIKVETRAKELRADAAEAREIAGSQKVSGAARAVAHNRAERLDKQADAAEARADELLEDHQADELIRARRAETLAQQADRNRRTGRQPENVNAGDYDRVFEPEAKQLGKDELDRARGAIRDKAIDTSDPEGVPLSPADKRRLADEAGMDYDAKTDEIRPEVMTEQHAAEIAPVKLDELVRDAATADGRPHYIWQSGRYKGERVTGDQLHEINPGGAFVRGAKLKTDPRNRVLSEPEAGVGYEAEDLLQRRGDRMLDSELEKQQRGTLARMTQVVTDRYAHRDAKGNVQEFVTEEGAQRLAGTLDDHVAMKIGDHYVAVPKVIARRADAQLAPIGHVEALGRWGTRTAIRATLPFSMAWHFGNVIDLATRLALTTSPRSWATEGIAMAKALEHQMGELDPDLRDELLATLKGHMGSRQTLRRPRASDTLYRHDKGDYAFPHLAASGDALGNLVRKTGGPWMIDKAFDISSDIESRMVSRAIGAHAKDYARDLGIQIADASTMMRELAEQLVDDPNKVHALQARVLETVGDYTTRAPWERKVMRGIDPFWKWLKASTKFVMLTLPAKHPIKTALMLNMAKMTADERTKSGLNQYWSDEEYDELRAMIGAPARGEGFTLGALGGENSVSPTGGLTSFGEVAKNISDPAALAGRPLSFVSRAATAAAGYYRTPGEIGVKALPGGGERSDLKLPRTASRRDRALQLGSEVALPGLHQLRRVLEGGTRPDLDSTAWSPSSAPEGAGYAPRSLHQGLDAALNPFHKQLPYSDPVKSTKQAIAAAPGQMFKVRHQNVDGSYTVYWVRRAP